MPRGWWILPSAIAGAAVWVLLARSVLGATACPGSGEMPGDMAAPRSSVDWACEPSGGVTPEGRPAAR